MVAVELRRPIDGREMIARRILAALPSWFGRPASTAGYIEIAGYSPMLAAYADDEAVGFLTLVDGPEPGTAEISVIGVLPKLHRQGIGRMLVGTAVEDCRVLERRTLYVQTVGAAHPDAGYGRTRAFYAAVGFRKVRETPDAWGPGTPALLLALDLR